MLLAFAVMQPLMIKCFQGPGIGSPFKPNTGKFLAKTVQSLRGVTAFVRIVIIHCRIHLKAGNLLVLIPENTYRGAQNDKMKYSYCDYAPQPHSSSPIILLGQSWKLGHIVQSTSSSVSHSLSLMSIPTPYFLYYHLIC